MSTLEDVGAVGIDIEDNLRSWVEAAARFVQTLPPKTARPDKRGPKTSRK